MMTVCLIRPSGPSTDVQKFFNLWAGTHILPLIHASHSLTGDFDGLYGGPPATLSHAVKTSDIVIFFGHGDWDRLIVRDHGGAAIDWVCASPSSPALDARDFAGKYVVAVACKSGHNLGPALMASGATGFLGFEDSVAYIPSPWVSSSHFEEAFVSGPAKVLDLFSKGHLPAAVIGADSNTVWQQMFQDVYNFFFSNTVAAGNTKSIIVRVWALFAKSRVVAF
jgi:hypothetical protein